MQLTVIPTPFFSANALILQSDESSSALVVDPSHGVLDQLERICDERGLTVGGILCTHGHPDHVWDAAQAAGIGRSRTTLAGEQAPVWVCSPDMYRMDDPLSHIPFVPEGMELAWTRPSDLRAIPIDTWEITRGLQIRMFPAPGHTEGSALFLGHSTLEVIDSGGEILWKNEEFCPWALTGDVLFRGSVGRTDLSGGDETQMRQTLRTIAHVIDPKTVLIPGHGPLTTLSHELEHNPYLMRALKSY